MNKNRDAKGYYIGIINPYNGHNRDLVDKICDAWDNPKYHDDFGDILYALSQRDAAEIEDKFEGLRITSSYEAMQFAHEIMEGVCDDWDLETILSFIRYKED